MSQHGCYIMFSVSFGIGEGLLHQHIGILSPPFIQESIKVNMPGSDLKDRVELMVQPVGTVITQIQPVVQPGNNLQFSV